MSQYVVIVCLCNIVFVYAFFMYTHILGSIVRLTKKKNEIKK